VRAESYASHVARLVGINHVVLEVGDLEEALEFYGGIFDFELRGRAPRMAFLDMGDQFLVLAEGGSHAHFGLVVDDGAQVPERNFRDPWGNWVQVVQYEDIQFSKTPEVLAGMGLDGLEKSEAAQRELREKGLG
jgi:catechol 2,3-dioxygenase-like lactoylglutathione lyase family enzyme